MERFAKALALSPRDPQRWAFLTYGALALVFKRDFSAGSQWAARAQESPNCQYWAVARLLAQEPRFSQSFGVQRRLLRSAGDHAAAQADLAVVQHGGLPGRHGPLRFAEIETEFAVGH